MTINWTSRRPLCFVPGRCNFIVLQPAADLSCVNIARMEFLSRARHAEMRTADCRSRWRLMSSAALDKLSPTSQDLVAALPVFLIFSYWRSVQNISVQCHHWTPPREVRGYENTAVINLITPRFADTGCSIIGNTNHYRDSRQSDLDSFCERCSWVNTRAGASAAMAARLLLQSYSCCGGMIDRCASQSEDSPRHRDAAASHSRELFLELCRFPSSHASSSSHEAAKYVLKVLVWSIRISTINICIMLASQIPERGRGLWGLPSNHNNITARQTRGRGEEV